MAVIQKAQMMTVVLTKDRDFKLRSVNFMNTIAFPAEKNVVEKLTEVKAIIDSNPRVLNMILDGTAIEDINKNWEEVIKLTTNPLLMILLYLPEVEMRQFRHHSHGKPNLYVRTMPFNKVDFNEAFHIRGGGPGKKAVAPGPGSPFAKVEAPQEAQLTAAQQKSISAFEASSHVRETIGLLNTFQKEPANLKLLEEVGQRFNGISGSFAFLGTKVGIQQLVRLSIVIDDIARTYSKNPKLKEISKEHLELLMGSAKCSFKILQALREGNDAGLELVQYEEQLYKTYSAATDILRQEKKSQDEVDKLLESIGK